MAIMTLVRFLAFLSILLQGVTSFQIGQLLSTCIHACQKGCEEIRQVQAERGSTDLEVELKDADNPKSALTQADEAAQRAIVGSLRHTWGESLHIVGEEDETVTSFGESDLVALDKTLLDDDIGETEDIDPSTITIFVDPLDGTREFVEGRLENCQVLVGIAINGRAVAGVIGMPFPCGNLTVPSTIVYGLSDAGAGVIGATLTRGPFPLERNIDGVTKPRPHFATGDSQHPAIRAAVERVIANLGGSNVIYGGAGNKILAASLGEVSCCMQHIYGGPWDVCAPEAIARAMGAEITDFFGEQLQIYARDAPPRCNERGYVVSAPGQNHQALINSILSSEEVQKYRKDVMNE